GMDDIFHAVARGAEGAPIFVDDVDRAAYLEALAGVVGRHRWRCLAYCLMGNHTHLLVGAARGDLRAGIRALRAAHARALGVRHGRPADAVWAPAVRPVRIRDDRQLWAAAAYVAAN